MVFCLIPKNKIELRDSLILVILGNLVILGISMSWYIFLGQYDPSV